MEDTAWGFPGRPQGLGVGFASEDWGLVGSPGVLVGPTGTTALIKKKKKKIRPLGSGGERERPL